ncbi:MAG: enoyl-CoA hydratase-related protein [Desulfobacterales bacterium]
MDFHDIIYEIKGKACHITLNRPDKLNALSKSLMDELDAALDEAENTRDIHVIVIKGAGRSFSAGFDIGPTAYGSPDAYPDVVADKKQLMENQRHWWRIWDCTKPVIARVHGYCLAGGTELAMMCDLVVCAEDSQFGYPPLRDMGSPLTPIWPWIVGARWAKMLYFTGDTIDGKIAESIGMVNIAVPAERLDEAVELLSQRIANVPPDLLMLHKQQVNRAFEIMGIRTALASGPEFDAIGHFSRGAREGFFLPAMKNGIKWVLEKRAGLFKGNIFDMIKGLKQ